MIGFVGSLMMGAGRKTFLWIGKIVLILIIIAATLLAARRAGRQAERLDNLKAKEKIRDAQLKAANNAVRNRRELAGRLHDGSF